MARPRVFVSSTFYDLQHVRADIDEFIKSLGYEPVMFERGSVPYRQDARLEEQCFAEIARSDILVAIVGDKFGSEAKTAPGSISQNELRRALDEGKQVYVFILGDVSAAHRIYSLNKNKAQNVEYGVDVRVLDFVDEVKALPTTGVHEFRSAAEIVAILREQWAGLFQELLTRRQQVEQEAMLNRVAGLATKMEEALSTLVADRWSAQAISHPGIVQLRKLLGMDYRIYVLKLDELEKWLAAIGFARVQSDDDELVWMSKSQRLSIRDSALFNAKGVLQFAPPTWDESAIKVEELNTSPGFDDSDYGSGDDDIPF